MIYTVETCTPVETIKLEMEEHTKAHGFGLLHVYEFQKILHNKGFPIEKEITLFELCSPQGAQQALSQIAAMSVYLPCRISL